MIYQLLRKAMFLLDAEQSHFIGLEGLKWLNEFKLTSKIYPRVESKPIQVMGLTFQNVVGLAAGLDKNGNYIEGLGALGFGFVEVGTVTRLPQSGNPKPRLFRLPEAEAIINRMGFNNLGVENLISNVGAAKTDALIGINIGKNKNTPVERTIEDYVFCLRKVYDFADYVTINISSPNTPGLRDLQFGEPLKDLLRGLKAEQASLAEEHERYVPMAVKVAPDLTQAEVQELAITFAEIGIDGVIATNTTTSRHGVESLPDGKEEGGLSGRPMCERSTEIVRQFRSILPKSIPIIAAGGIMSGKDAQQKIAAGASLVQIYSGLIYQGPGLIKEIIKATR